MGRNKSWTADEKEVLARAWIAASEVRSEIDGAGKENEMFWDLVLDEIRKRMPQDAHQIVGRYSMRAISAIKSHWSDKVKNNASKFNTALMIIYRSNPTGSSRQQMINMAVAIHLGKTSKMEYQYRDINPNEWINYKAWSHLRHHHKFAPPAPPSLSASSSSAGGDAGKEEEADETPTADAVDDLTINSNPFTSPGFLDTQASLSGGSTTAGINSAPVPSVVAPSMNVPASGNGKRGRGRNAAKAQQALEEHRRKKFKAIKDLTEVQKRRLQSQNSYMKFTVLKWQIENCTDLAKLEHYQSLMDKIMEELMEEETPTLPPLVQTMGSTQATDASDATEHYLA
jgi:hypothetical protein